MTALATHLALPNMSDEKTTPRREFLGQVAASAIVLAGAACATPAAIATPAPTPAPAAPPANGTAPQAGGGGGGGTIPARTSWDDSWFAKLTAKHKAVFDSPEINDGLVIANATGYIRGMRDALGATDNDIQTVVVIRHAAVVMLFNDAMWEKYSIGRLRSVKAARGEGWATKNQWVGTASARPAEGTVDRPQSTFAWLASRNHFILGCDLATRNVAGVIARDAKVESRVVYEDLTTNMIPGVILQPTGVYACHRAQEAGCTYIRST
jgi:hypothetical protein